LEDWNRLNGTLLGISGYYAQDSSELSGEMPEKMKCEYVAPRFLQVLGVAPELGRDFTRQEEHDGGPNAVLISDRLWRRRFSASSRCHRQDLTLREECLPCYRRDAARISPSPLFLSEFVWQALESRGIVGGGFGWQKLPSSLDEEFASVRLQPVRPIH
jgi:hypothetical protein